MKYIKKLAVPFLFVMPFIIGIIGFLMEGESLLDSAYNSFALYAVNPLYEEKNFLIEITRWLAPAVVASGLLVFVKELSRKIKDFFLCMKKDSFAIYGDSAERQELAGCIDNAVISSDLTFKDADNHIIMFNDDGESFRFFNKNRERLKNKNVYIKSDNIEMFKNDSDEFRIINLNELVARNYWVEHNLMKYFAEGKNEIQISLIGFDGIAQEILNYAILNNIYSLSQKITYHIWGDCELYSSVHSDLNLMNSDKIVYHKESWQSSIDIISESDRIIFPVLPAMDSLIMLAEKCRKSDIHCYKLDENLLGIVRDEGIVSFGQIEKILIKDSVFLTDVYRSAKLLNFRYACLYGDAKESDGEEGIEAQWKKLNTFLRTSNISASDYHSIRKIIAENTEYSDSVMAEMEHIRWSRFHFLNHWRAGVTENGKKDSSNRIHPCLVPFEALPQIDKEKDSETIKLLTEIQKKQTKGSRKNVLK